MYEVQLSHAASVHPIRILIILLRIEHRLWSRSGVYRGRCLIAAVLVISLRIEQYLVALRRVSGAVLGRAGSGGNSDGDFAAYRTQSCRAPACIASGACSCR